ncbi:MAG: rod shape-determining protein MreD [Acidobacteria bacterium]|nr:rod shape-determining protein MreD [Acidobacteriota bacterium]
MKLTAVLLTVVGATFLQVALARFTVGGVVVFDLVLVGAVFAALEWGPVAGILAGTVGGLLQDLLSGDIIGVGALAKTLVGWAAGVVGAQFVLVRSHARMIIVAFATVVHRAMILMLRGLIDQHWPAVSWGAILAETGLNAAAALLVFYAIHMLPAAVERQRVNRRSSLSRRQW